jgi:hypothetical protein
MQVIKPVIGWLLIMGTIFYSGCKKNDSDPTNTGGEQPGKIRGFGDVPGEPEGPQFQLPKHVSLVGPIKGVDGLDDPTGNECLIDGQGESVMVTMTLEHDSTVGKPIEVEFPAGLVIVSAAESFQHGLLVERVTVTLPPKYPGPGGPGDKNPQCEVRLMLSCLNESKAPSENTETYKFGPVTSSSLVKDLIKRLSTKKIRYKEYMPDEEAWEEAEDVVQHALWSITDGKGLTKRDLEAIASLPNK